ncbi:metallophosphoesterase [Shimazuella sp. AN120528]|uniref:metallophosphoesterase n=1 Tax=Shimazuella soli TaxID=1892854 RepID=UPI001F0D766B|nr:metallophosphoesterase [Shimazuella soli]MCH5584504.1 metallophosphoesterase [Shimazuella soli]
MNQHLSRRAFLKRALFGFLSLIPLTAGYSYGIEPRWLEVSEKFIRLPRLASAFEGMRVVVFGDLHVGFHMNEDDVSHVVTKVNSLKPDLLLFTGDLVDDKQDVLFPILPHLQKLHAPLGKFAVLGNHDYQGDLVTPNFEHIGFHVLRNRHHLIRKGQDTLVIAGVEDMLMGKPSLNQAIEGAPDTCTLLLSHCPDFASNIVSNQVDLQISGHSHGGQIRLPFLGAMITPPGGRIYTDGFYSLEKTNVYVNRGIGTTILPFRFHCRPQISILHLSRT